MIMSSAPVHPYRLKAAFVTSSATDYNNHHMCHEPSIRLVVFHWTSVLYFRTDAERL